MTDNYAKARALLSAAAGFAARTEDVDDDQYPAFRDSVMSSAAAAQAYATLALVDALRDLRPAPVVMEPPPDTSWLQTEPVHPKQAQALRFWRDLARHNPSGARGGEPTSEGATPA